MNTTNANRTMTTAKAAKLIRGYAKNMGSTGLHMMYSRLASYGYTGETAEDILDEAGISATVVEHNGGFVACAQLLPA